MHQQKSATDKPGVPTIFLRSDQLRRDANPDKNGQADARHCFRGPSDMATALSLVAVAIALISIGYTVWKDSQLTVDAGAAWRAKRRLEEAIVTHLRTFKMELKLDEHVPERGEFLCLATDNLRAALEDGRVTGLPRVLVHKGQTGKESKKEDFLTEWIMLERHVRTNLDELASESKVMPDDRLDPGQAVLLLEQIILKNLVPLSRREIRRVVGKRLELSPVEQGILDALEADTRNVPLRSPAEAHVGPESHR